MRSVTPAFRQLRLRQPGSKANGKVDPSTIDWDLNEGKQAADECIFRTVSYDLLALQRRGEPIRVLSTPGATWRWERRLEQAFPGVKFRFMGLEHDVVTHAKLRDYTDSMPERFATTEEPQTALEFMSQNRREDYDLIYLDWMGTWSREKAAQAEAVTALKMLSVGGILVMTMSVARGRPESTSALSRYPLTLPCAFLDARSRNTFIQNVKVCGVPRWVADRAAQHGAKLTPVMVDVYYSKSSDSWRVTPQLRFTLRRDK